MRAEALELERRPPDPPLLDFKLFLSELVGNFEAHAPCLSKPKKINVDRIDKID